MEGTVGEKLFRKAAFDKVSSPEQLDLLMRVTSPATWLALSAAGIVLAAAVTWTVFGSIPDLVDGQGTLFRGERLLDVKAPMGGTIVSLDVKPGAAVEAGQVIGTIRYRQAGIEERYAAEATIEKNRAMLARKQTELGALEQQRAGQQYLVGKGILARNELLRSDREILSVQGEIDALERENRSLQARMDVRAELKAVESGRVVEVIKSPNDTVAENDPLLRIEPDVRPGHGFCGGDLHAIVYVSAATAARVRPGHPARVSPAGVKKEEYGFIPGRVEWIASRPASTDDMTEKLKNDQLVRAFMAAGPVFEARVCLDHEAGGAANRLRWSSSRGPQMAIDAGSTCAASVVVEERRPMTYVIPAIRRVAGL
jgi:HlyD family secretion protein